MNEEDIKKALECCGCGVTKCVCNECPIRYRESCLDDLPKIALDLINRQQAEIEKLENAIIALMSYLDILGADKTDTSFINQATEFNKQIRADIKSEAIKEFAERLKIDWQENDFYWEDADVYKWIDNLVKEMVGEQDA